jgi:diaminopimelate epimerase
MDFTKMTGAGNDFIVLGSDRRLSSGPEAIRLLCDRRYGIGADGLMVIHGPAGVGTNADGFGEVGDEVSDGSSATAFSVDFYNADGSGGMLCGNGARCALVYAAGHRLVAYGQTATFSFAGKDYNGIALASDRARFMLDPRYATWPEEEISIGELTVRGRYVDLGSLHFVVGLEDLPVKAAESCELAGRPQGQILEQLDVAALGAALRNHPRFAPSGVNVNFCSLIDGRLHVRTFERGVEAETLACGTGSTASALSYALKGRVSAPVHIVTRSGEELIIDFDNPARPSRLSLEGPAKVVFQGRIQEPGRE